MTATVEVAGAVRHFVTGRHAATAVALDGVDLSVGQDEIVVVVGTTGSGR